MPSRDSSPRILLRMGRATCLIALFPAAPFDLVRQSQRSRHDLFASLSSHVSTGSWFDNLPLYIRHTYFHV